jgi:uncharacterized protein (DUF4415 family)
VNAMKTLRALKTARRTSSTRVVRVSLRVDGDVLAAFKATGPGWQTRINALLRDAVAHGLVKG